jgi:hypothetical protein
MSHQESINSPDLVSRNLQELETPFYDVELLARPNYSLNSFSIRARQAGIHVSARPNNGNTRLNATNTLMPVRMNVQNPTIHPQFRSKAVCSLFCCHCDTNLCERGMRAILLGNTSIELYSTDKSPRGVALVAKDYFTKNCSYLK